MSSSRKPGEREAGAEEFASLALLHNGQRIETSEDVAAFFEQSPSAS